MHSDILGMYIPSTTYEFVIRLKGFKVIGFDQMTFLALSAELSSSIHIAIRAIN